MSRRILPTQGQILTASEAMRFAIQEGRRGAGFVSPNPLVGCVILDREHRFLASGFHAKLGGDHAEIAAIKKISEPDKIRGGHFYVTLEPCSHQGRTGPCARAIAPLQPATVTYAVEDPNPLVSGRGAQILREAGIRARHLAECHEIDDRQKLIDLAEDLAEIFLHNQRRFETFVAAKMASSLDGQVALLSGESKWITSEKSRNHAHLIRARYDAIAVGVTTLESDDPSLNVRHANFPDFKNKAVVFDPTGRGLAFLRTSQLLRVREREHVVIVVDRAQHVGPTSGATVLPVQRRDRTFDLDEVLSGLRGLGIHSLLIEGGAKTTSAFFNARKIQRLHAYLAPSLLGAKQAVAWSSGFGVPSLEKRIRLENSMRRMLGDDLYWTARVKFPAPV